MEFEVNSNEKILDGIDHCYAFGKVNDETIFSDNDFPCPTFSRPYSNPDYIIPNDALSYVGGGASGVTGDLRIFNFEWLEDHIPCDSTNGVLSDDGECECVDPETMLLSDDTNLCIPCSADFGIQVSISSFIISGSYALIQPLK